MKLAILTLVIVHVIATLWHGDAHSTLGIDLPTLKILYVYAVILAAPIVGAILVWTRFIIFGAGLFAFSMVGAFVFGVYHHYVLVSPDNVAHLPTGLAEAHSQLLSSCLHYQGFSYSAMHMPLRQGTPNKTLHWPPDASVTELAVATSAPDTGASELNR